MKTYRFNRLPQTENFKTAADVLKSSWPQHSNDVVPL
jgi:hypothetical protein